jgi:peptide chain release factor
MSVSGAEASAFARSWAGSLQWICPSPIRPGHKRKNWFVAVDLLATPDAGAGTIEVRDVVFEAMRAAGPGGQHVNKTESAVRATHKPTGIVVTAREERSQAMNRKLALARLATALEARVDAARAHADNARWARHEQLERGNAIRIFEGPDFRERRAKS